MLGILVVDKPIGITSHDVVNRVRRAFHTKRVGHSGTLDPLATGVLVLAIGPATRFLQYLPLEPKEYVAHVRFGASTTTFDAEGEVTPGGPLPANLESALEEILPEFKGLIQQIPPMFSAIKKDGKPLYELARQGQVVHRDPRTIHIGSLKVESCTENEAVIRIECSGGTYIRTLADDLGSRLGCGAYLVGLDRTRVGVFTRDHAVALDKAALSDLVPLRIALGPMPQITLDERKVRSIREGQIVGIAEPPDSKLVALLTQDGNVFSIGRVEGNMVQPECVIPEGVPLGVD